jgi:hypothetical protein
MHTPGQTHTHQDRHMHAQLPSPVPVCSLLVTLGALLSTHRARAAASHRHPQAKQGATQGGQRHANGALILTTCPQQTQSTRKAGATHSAVAGRGQQRVCTQQRTRGQQSETHVLADGGGLPSGVLVAVVHRGQGKGAGRGCGKEHLCARVGDGGGSWRSGTGTGTRMFQLPHQSHHTT